MILDFLDKTKTSTISKNTILLRSGEVCKAGYFVLKGCLKSYVIDSKGKEHIIQFAPEEWIISDMDSLINSGKSVLFIEAIEDSEVLVLTRDLLDSMDDFDKDVLIEMNQRLFRNIIASNKRLIALMSSTAEERYLSFIRTYPTLVQRLPLKLIASYIGVTPEYLSEIRRKIAGK